MTLDERKRVLARLGAPDADMDALTAYTENMFRPRQNEDTDELSPKWPDMRERIQAACASAPKLEMFASAAGVIPIVYAANDVDFNNLMREIVYKGKEMPDISNVGAQFVYGKTLRFIILSNKPYSGVTAAEIGLPEAEWIAKSVVIRKYHECAHYYTKRFMGISRNNLHDELIADFCGLYAAFGDFRAEWFMMFYKKREHAYTTGLSGTAADIIRTLAECAAKSIEEWTRTEGFAELNESERIEYLTGLGLLDYIKEDN